MISSRLPSSSPAADSTRWPRSVLAAEKPRVPRVTSWHGAYHWYGPRRKCRSALGHHVGYFTVRRCVVRPRALPNAVYFPETRLFSNWLLAIINLHPE